MPHIYDNSYSIIFKFQTKTAKILKFLCPRKFCRAQKPSQAHVSPEGAKSVFSDVQLFGQHDVFLGANFVHLLVYKCQRFLDAAYKLFSVTLRHITFIIYSLAELQDICKQEHCDLIRCALFIMFIIWLCSAIFILDQSLSDCSWPKNSIVVFV